MSGIVRYPTPEGGASVTVSDTAPLDPETGDLWYESDTGKTFVYYDSYWVEPVASTGATGATGPTGPTGIGYSSVVSSTSVTIGTGTKGWTVPYTGAFAIGDFVRVTAVGFSAYIEGTVTTGTFLNNNIYVDVTNTSGSGTFSSWRFGSAGIQGVTGPTGATGPTGPTGTVSLDSPAFTGTPTAPTATAGTNTTQLATTEFVTTAAAGVTSGFRNRLINGGFDIWQRWVATSIDVSAGATGYTADRWFMSPVGSMMGAIRDTNVPPTSLSKYSLQIAPNGTSGSTCNLGQRIESANVYALKGTVTFSAWIFNNTSASMTPVLLLGTPSAEDNFTTVTNRLTQSLQSCANGAWTKVTHTVDISGYTNINNGLQVEIQTSGHTTFGRIVRIAEVQLERNAQPTPFEQRPIGTELALCQRYYYRTGGEVSSDIYLSGYQPASTNIIFTYFHPVTMRATPSLAQKVGTWLLLNTPSQPIIGGASTKSYYAYITVNAGITNANQSGAYTNNSTTYFEFSSEL